jgi:putative DNA primase/helicase
MTLHAIVAALGGDLYNGGTRASVPAPGHSAEDRSVSLLLSGDRVVVHGFGGADWRVARDDLRVRGFIDATGRLTGGGCGRPSAARPDKRVRRETAAGLWAGTVALMGGSVACLHLHRRAITGGQPVLNVGLHPAAPLSVYRDGGRTRPALVARISDANDRLTAVELTYLASNGWPAQGLRVARKTVGEVPPGAAVRLSPVADEMLVGEGVITTLSAIARFGLPGWALMGANNLAAWTPPEGVRRILIAADRGRVGEGAAARLRHRLGRDGLEVDVCCPAPPYGDWNEVAVAAAQRKERGR